MRQLFPEFDLYSALKNVRKKNNKGCDDCGLYRTCKSPKMSGTGNVKAKIMIVGENPGKEEDRMGKPFVGKSGMLLRKMLEDLGIDAEKDCFITNATRCHKEVNGENQPPTTEQLHICFPFLEKEIKQIKPECIVLLGAKAFEAMLGVSEISKYSGYLIPYPKYSCTLLPTYHPSAALRSTYEYYPVIKNDLSKLLDYKKFIKHDRFEDHNIILNSIDELVEKLLEIDFAFDIENYPLSPFHPDAVLLLYSFAISDSESFTIRANPSLIPKLKYLFENKSVGRIIIHNYKHEYVWMKHVGGIEIPPYLVADTMLMSYMEKEISGIHSLEFQSRVRFWLSKVENPYIDDMRKCPEELLHKYGGVDAKLTFKLYKELHKKVSRELYELLVNAARALGEMELQGVNIDIEKLQTLEKEYKTRIENIMREIYILPEVQTFKVNRKSFNIRSTDDVGELLSNYYKIPLPLTKKAKKYATDSVILEQFSDNVFCNLLLEYRDIYKVLSTYVYGLRKHIGEDSKIHTHYHLHSTRTGRTSSQNPNLQNIDTHKHPEIRCIFTAPKNHLIVSFDYAQAEVRGAAMVSGDTYLRDSILNNVDIHEFWARKIYHGRTITKELRHNAKNKFVFPLIYGASYKSIAEHLKIDDDFAEKLCVEFFGVLHGLHEWQRRTLRFYMENGYVETYFHRRRHAPLTYNQMINFPIQSIISDFVLLSLIECVKLGYVPVLLVHDDLTFIVHESKLERLYREVMQVMTGWQFEWMNVPLEVDCKVGYNWGEQIDIKEIL